MEAEQTEKKHVRSGESLLLQALGETPKLRILDFLIDNPLFDFSKKEIIEGSGVSKATFYKYWDEIEGSGFVKETRKYGKTILYTINEDNPAVQKLMELDEALMEQESPD
ncbi:hypothetical protein AKJ38_01485 [candidate division MSBL1 archaeon SCGC-AAA259I14]|uniref:HTH arsR-type domain-containing protein n=1 Tax=candidate division MSBL1 archaeon SCGC-AAA259I14 TaxID=1698268 RepID=A0A133USW2_9EURY|nr:hypothetical protein AKJ38_01485 [candidate division MSBL1 archaeon SCGC-AAA259I14]